ncbi:MAG: aldo/keto reductase [Chloroflexota bacterium]
MKYNTIAGVDKPVSRLVQGTVYFSDQRPDEALNFFDGVFEHGCNTFDTAHGYFHGESEKALGLWIQERNNRDEIVILDKGAHPYDGRNRVTPADITSDIHESLERLGVDFIDIYILHRDDETVPVQPIMDCLYEHHQLGHIGVIGGSNWSHQRLQEANNYATKNNLLPFTTSSPQFSLAEMVKPAWDGCISVGHDEDAQAWYREQDMSLFTWSSLAGGFMTGKFTPDNLDTFEDYFEKVTVDAYAYEDNFTRLDRATYLAKEKDVSVPQLALAYVLNQPLNIFAIIGAMTEAQFAENALALEIDLSQQEIDWLNLKTNELASS